MSHEPLEDVLSEPGPPSLDDQHGSGLPAAHEPRLSESPSTVSGSSSSDWLAWQDPEVPEFLSPTSYLLDRHVGGGLGEKAAIVVDDVPVTYQELLLLVERVSEGLRELPVARGSRLLMVATDSVDFIVLWLACVRAGVIPVVVSDAVKPPQLAYYLRDNEPSALYVDAEQLPKLAAIAQRHSET